MSRSDEALCQIFGVEHVRGQQMVLVVHQVLALEHGLQHTGGVPRFGLPLPLGGIVSRLVGAQQVDQFVEQRHVRHRPGVAVGAEQCRIGARRLQALGRGVQRRQQ